MSATAELAPLTELQPLLVEVARRAAIDPQFRDLALKDAKAAIQRVTNKPISNCPDIVFVDNSGAVKTIPLPDPINPDELSQIELESAAGVAGEMANADVSWGKH